MADTSVKFYHSDMVGAPTLSGTAGAMIAVLDACLVNGWGTANVDAVVIAGGMATVTRGAGHPFEVGSVAELGGATVSGGSINGPQKVLSVTANTWTFDATGLADQAASGTISQKVSAAGWQKAFAGTNLAAYRSQDVTGTRFYCRVDDSNANHARAYGFEVMTDVNTGTGRWPTEAQQAGGYYWSKSNAASTAARRWVLVADGKTFYLALNWEATTTVNFSLSAAFGDLLAAGSADAYRAFVHGSLAQNYNNTPGTLTGASEIDVPVSASWATALPRGSAALGGPVQANRSFASLNSVAGASRSGDSAGAGLTAFPNPSDGGLYVAQYSVTEAVALAYRGRLPGLFALPQRVGSSVFGHRERVEAVQGLPGRVLRIVNTATGCVAFDTTGPWS